MFNDTQAPVYVPSEIATIVQAIADEVVRRKGARGNHQDAPAQSFYDANILVGARSICEALHSPDNPNQG